jgi:hypothetical protein
MAQPESITALMVAVGQEEGDEAVRLHGEALAAFERKRVEIVNPALVSRPRAMELRLPFVTPPDRDDFDDLPPDCDELGLDEVVPASPGSAKPNIALASAKSGPREPRQLTSRIGPAQPPPAETVVKRLWRKPQLPPTEKKRIVLRVWASPPPAERKKIIRRVRRKPMPHRPREGASSCSLGAARARLARPRAGFSSRESTDLSWLAKMATVYGDMRRQ